MQRNFLWIFSRPEDTRSTEEVSETETEVGTTHRGAPEPPGTPRWVVPPSGYPPGTSLAQLVSSGPEKIFKKFCCVWTLSGIDFLRSKKQAKNSNWHWALCQ